jgi:protein-S-isoprenylcysteine O-methyltransferase Ste14
MADLQTPAAAPNPVGTVAGRIKRLAQGLSMMVLWVAIVFVAAGRLNWARGWASVAVYVITMGLVGAIVQRRNPGLLAARNKWRRKDTPLFDRVFLAVFLPLTFVQVIVAALDASRYGWLPLAPWTFLPGVLMFLAATGIVLWTLLANPFAESVVRIQSDRGHRVIDTGPYRIVRHPMYAGMLLTYPGTACMFGSAWALAVSAVMAALLIWRTGREDRYLSEHLEGYSVFKMKTRYRLIPNVW